MEYGEAEVYLQRYLKAKPDSSEAYRLLGDLYLKQRRYLDAYEAHKRWVAHLHHLFTMLFFKKISCWFHYVKFWTALNMLEVRL